MNILTPMLEDIVANHKRLAKQKASGHQRDTQGSFAQHTEIIFEKERLFSFNRALVSKCRQAPVEFLTNSRYCAYV